MNVSPINYSYNYTAPKKLNKLNVETSGSIAMSPNQTQYNNLAFKANINKINK